MINIRSATAGLTVLGLGAIGVLGQTSAHADPAKKPLCVFVATPGTSGDISKIKCMNPNAGGADGMQSASWTGLSLVTPDGSSTIGYYTAGENGKDYWAYDPSLVNFGDFKKELSRDWGYTTVVLTGDTDNTGQPEIEAGFGKPSKTKH